jgi:uridylate kinase
MHKRVLLKVSGEALKKPGAPHFVDEESMLALAAQIADAFLRYPWLELYIMCGGGNYERGRALLARCKHIKDRTAHYAGMMYTLINTMFLRDILRHVLKGREIRLMSSISVKHVAEDFYPEVADNHGQKGRVTLLGGGSGKTGMTTDLAGSIMAKELECEVLLKGTKVDGLYTFDPTTVPEGGVQPEFISQISYGEYKRRGYDRIFDSDAVGKVEKDSIPVRIFNVFKPGLLTRIIGGDLEIGTIISHSEKSEVVTVRPS